jgi:hypothetical protein
MRRKMRQKQKNPPKLVDLMQSHQLHKLREGFSKPASLRHGTWEVRPCKVIEQNRYKVTVTSLSHT